MLSSVVTWDCFPMFTSLCGTARVTMQKKKIGQKLHYSTMQ